MKRTFYHSRRRRPQERSEAAADPRLNHGVHALRARIPPSAVETATVGVVRRSEAVDCVRAPALVVRREQRRVERPVLVVRLARQRVREHVLRRADLLRPQSNVVRVQKKPQSPVLGHDLRRLGRQLVDDEHPRPTVVYHSTCENTHAHKKGETQPTNLIQYVSQMKT